VTFKAMVITLIVFGLIMVVVYYARPKITNWRTYAAATIGTLAGVVSSEWHRLAGRHERSPWHDAWHRRPGVGDLG
jgi:hypothetical protein